MQNGDEIIINFKTSAPTKREKVVTAPIQMELNRVLGTNLRIDGWYGDNTQGAVEELQSVYGLPQSNGKGLDVKTFLQLKAATPVGVTHTRVLNDIEGFDPLFINSNTWCSSKWRF